MRKFLLIFFALLTIILVGFIYWKFFFVFSEGNREGVLNKFSTKGTVFKTHEGELLMPGVVPTMNQLSNNFFYFSATDAEVTSRLNDATGKKIKVHYVQYNSALPWRGENYGDRNKEGGQYIVDQVEVISN